MRIVARGAQHPARTLQVTSRLPQTIGRTYYLEFLFPARTRRLVKMKSARASPGRKEKGLYDLPDLNRLTGKPTNPDYAAVIDAVARRDQIRILVDGLTAANQLGLANAVPAQVIVHTDARIRPIKLGNLTVTFKLTAPSRLYWAGRPAMRVVQALHWVRDLLPRHQKRILKRLRAIGADPVHGAAIRADLVNGIHTLPTWMQDIVRKLVAGDRNRAENSRHPSS